MWFLLAQPPAHNTVPCFSWHWSPVSAPALIFTSFLPADTRLAQFLGFHEAAKAQWREKGFRSHFIKQATRPRRLAFHRYTPHPEALGSVTVSPCSHPLGALGSWNSGGQKPTWLLESSSEGLSCCGQPGQLMQFLKDIHSLLGTYEPGGTQARPEQVGSLSSIVAEKWA